MNTTIFIIKAYAAGTAANNNKNARHRSYPTIAEAIGYLDNPIPGINISSSL